MNADFLPFLDLLILGNFRFYQISVFFLLYLHGCNHTRPKRRARHLTPVPASLPFVCRDQGVIGSPRLPFP